MKKFASWRKEEECVGEMRAEQIDGGDFSSLSFDRIEEFYQPETGEVAEFDGDGS